MRVETKALLGAGLVASAFDGKIAIVFGSAVAGWVTYKLHNNFTAEYLNASLARLQQDLQEFEELDPEVHTDRSQRIARLKKLNTTIQNDLKTLKLSSTLLGVATFLNPLFGILFTVGSLILRKEETERHINEIDRIINDVLEEEPQAA